MRERVMRGAALMAAAAIMLSAAGCGSSQQDDTNSVETVAASGGELVAQKLDEGIYSLDYKGDYKLDEYLEADIQTVEDLDKWFMENLTKGISTEGSEFDMACSSFAVATPEGEHLLGRNYDLDQSDSMFIRTKPDGGYASIGIVDLGHLNIGQGCEAEIDSQKGKSLLEAAPYCICDGINEKGLGVSLLQLTEPHKVNDTDKHDLLVYIALRALLDKCADADEAVAMLGEYDIYSPHPQWSYHVFITDKSGKSVVVEWVDGEMKVVEDNAVTNFILFEAPAYRDPDGRYTKLKKALEEKSTATNDEAMEMLGTVKVDWTRWSAVYDLEKFMAEVCFNGDLEKKYEFGGQI